MSDQLVVERQGLEKKDKAELQTIVAALGGNAPARMTKAALIDQILSLTGVTDGDGPSASGGEGAKPATSAESEAGSETQAGGGDDEPSTNGSAGKGSGQGSKVIDDSLADDDHPLGPDGEPLADWEVKVLEEGGQLPSSGGKNRSANNRKGDRSKGSDRKQGGQSNQSKDAKGSDRKQGGRNNRKGDKNDQGDKGDKADDGNTKSAKDRNTDDDDGNRRSRRRRGRGRDRDDAGEAGVSEELVRVEGYLDLRDEGYAFLRVDGFLPSRHDAYVSVKQVRQHRLRKGDHVVGMSRAANRNEKNPALNEVELVNGVTPGNMKSRVEFDSLTPLFPDERLVLETKDEPLNMTTRIIDLLAPIGKGQRGLIVSPPKAGKTSIMKAIASAIETNNPEVELLVLLVDERPEEVTDMKRHLKRGEVVASTFDRPPDEHTAVAEITLERAKRMAEDGKDVVMIVDGITRLARAYNMSAPQSGRALSGGIDAAALYPPKRFLGAARNFEEGGSLTILATALVETGSKMDEVIFEECKGTGNMELRLDRRLAEKRIFPAIDVDGSSTRNEELLRDRKEVEASWKLRRVISAMAGAEDARPGAGVEMLVERLAQFKTNAQFLEEIRKS